MRRRGYARADAGSARNAAIGRRVGREAIEPVRRQAAASPSLVLSCQLSSTDGKAAVVTSIGFG